MLLIYDFNTCIDRALLLYHSGPVSSQEPSLGFGKTSGSFMQAGDAADVNGQRPAGFLQAAKKAVTDSIRNSLRQGE